MCIFVEQFGNLSSSNEVPHDIGLRLNTLRYTLPTTELRTSTAQEFFS